MEKKRILIADSDRNIFSALKKKKGGNSYLFEYSANGADCLKKIDSFLPDLIVIELMLPQIHGIEILRKIKNDPRTKHIGVVVMCANALIQNYHTAIKQRADYFLEKPFEISSLLSLFKLFFSDLLHPEPFSGKDSYTSEVKHCYLPKLHPTNTYIKFWGTRGSNPVSGSDYVRFGGNTCCLEVRHGHDLIIIDAGTGIRPLGNLLNESKPKHIHLLFSHTHWDHLAGFPFFLPIYDPDSHIHIYTPIGFEKTSREIFTEMLAYAYFPVRLDDIQASLHFTDIREGIPFEIGHFQINSHYAYHPGATICFKIRCNKTTFAYVTDNEFLMGYHGNPHAITRSNARLAPYLSQIKFFKDCDFLIHEAQYTPEEYQYKVGWGHSSVSNLAVLLKHAEVKEWIITHHDPKHTDMDLLKKIQMQFDIIDDCKLDCRARMAFDGLAVPL